MTPNNGGRGRPRRLLDPRKSPGEARAWALACLMDESGKNQTTIAKDISYNKATVSRVTDPQQNASVDVVAACVDICGQSPDLWVQMHTLAKAVAGNREDVERFARALWECCVAGLPQKYLQQLGSIQNLVASWAGIDADDGTPTEHLLQPPITPHARPAPPATAGAGTGGEQPQHPHHEETREPKGPEPDQTSPSPLHEAGGNPSAEAQRTNPRSTPEAGPRRKQPLRRVKRLTIGGITCLGLLVAAGAWQLWNHTGEASPSSTVHPNPTTPPIDQTVNTELMKRLEAAQKGKRKWVIGVKRNQPGLSVEIAPDKWAGADIKYAEAIAKALGIKTENIHFVGIGTEDRPFKLSNKEVDMFVGTYGISDDRKSGDSTTPGVAFAGPYLQTNQKIMMELGKGHKAIIRGHPQQINSISDLLALRGKEAPRVCVVKDSSADEYLSKEKEFPGRLRLTDYDACIGKLKVDIDAVITDATILDGFDHDNKGQFIIAQDSLPTNSEEYGIGLNRNAVDLRTKICKAMNTPKVIEETEEAYGSLPDGTPITAGCAPS